MGILYNRYTDDAIDLTGYSGQSWSSVVAPRLITSGMTDMSYMFNGQSNATSIDVSNFDTSNVTNMSSMFEHCESVTSLDVSNFDTSMVKDMTSMFSRCESVTSLDVSNFDTSKVTSMNYMFDYCRSISSLDFDSWDTSKVTNMHNMFVNSFNSGGKLWVPSTFVATAVSSDSNKPFNSAPTGQVDVYTDATDATTQGWGTINAKFTMHYNTTHQDFLNA